MSEGWKKLDEDGKKKYEDLAAKDKERYQKQLAEFENTGKFTPATDIEEKEDEKTEAEDAAEEGKPEEKATT